MDLGEGCKNVVRGGCVGKSTTTPPTNPHPNPPPQPVTEAPENTIAAAIRETARPKKSEPKSTAAPKRAAGKSKKKAAAIVKTEVGTTHNLVVPSQCPTSSLEEISDLLDQIPLHACV